MSWEDRQVIRDRPKAATATHWWSFVAEETAGLVKPSVLPSLLVDLLSLTRPNQQFLNTTNASPGVLNLNCSFVFRHWRTGSKGWGPDSLLGLLATVWWKKLNSHIDNHIDNHIANHIETYHYLLLFISFPCYWNWFWPRPKDVTYINFSLLQRGYVHQFFFAPERLRTSICPF